MRISDWSSDVCSSDLGAAKWSIAVTVNCSCASLRCPRHWPAHWSATYSCSTVGLSLAHVHQFNAERSRPLRNMGRIDMVEEKAMRVELGRDTVRERECEIV